MKRLFPFLLGEVCDSLAKTKPSSVDLHSLQACSNTQPISPGYYLGHSRSLPATSGDNAKLLCGET